MPEIVLWDSCIVIDAIQQQEDIYIHLQPMIRKAEAGELFIVVSSVTVAEVTYCKELSAKGVSQEEQNEIIQQWMNQDYIVRRIADFGICRSAAMLAREFSVPGKSLSPIDSIVLATAIKNNVDALITLDDGKGKKSGKSIGLLELDQRAGGDRKTRIMHPATYVQQFEWNF